MDAATATLCSGSGTTGTPVDLPIPEGSLSPGAANCGKCGEAHWLKEDGKIPKHAAK